MKPSGASTQVLFERKAAEASEVPAVALQGGHSAALPTPPHGSQEGGRSLRTPAQKRKQQQRLYLISAVVVSLVICGLAAVTIYMRAQKSTFLDMVLEALGGVTVMLASIVGMETFARWAHKNVWHDSALSRRFFPVIPVIHWTHHTPRKGLFERNDMLSVVNAIPAIAACAWGCSTPGVIGAIALGAGVGVSLYGMSYMFIHDGLIHGRFPVGPLADIPYFQRVAQAHKLHHANKLEGVPFGLFRGPAEVEQAGAKALLDRMCKDASAVTD